MINFNQPCLIGNELQYIQQAYEQQHVSGDGIFTRHCQEFLQTITESSKVLLTTSCSHALELAALLLDIQPGDEVIAPSFTFVSTVNAFVLRGAKPVFIDIREDTLNFDEMLLPDLITPKTRAIVPVHYAGVGCEMNSIMSIAKEKAIAVVEDNAHGLFGKYQGKPLGSFGSMATQSFHETKNISCGEGGAILINNPSLIERAEIIREKGTNRSRFFRGMVDKYTWVDIGSSYLPSDILAAILWAQFEQWESIQNHRKSIWNRYAAELKSWALNNNARLPFIPDDCEQAYHMFYILLPNLEQRQRFITHMAEKQIHVVFHYIPLHTSPMGLSFGGKKGQCPVTEDISDRLVRLPLHPAMNSNEQDKVIEAIHQFKV